MEVFNYLRRLLDWSDDDCPVFIRNTRKARQVWGRLGKFLQREGAGPSVSEIFYRTVVQVVLLFRADTWVLLALMSQILEVEYVGFLWQVIRKRQRG